MEKLALRIQNMNLGRQEWYFVTKIVPVTEKKLLKFEDEGREFTKSLEHFLVTECFFNLFPETFSYLIN